ncbi:F-box protein [Rosa sericea]
MDPDWEHLPRHLLDSVIGRLVKPSDFLLFSIVCKSWYSVAKDNKSKLAKMTTPMLLISTNKRRTWNLYNIVENRVVDMQFSVPNKRYCGSSKGWLIAVEKNYAVTLVNPFFRLKGRRKKENSIIRLPPMPAPLERDMWKEWSRTCEYYAFRSTLSADPILNAEDCVLVIIYGEYSQMAFIRPRRDKTWTFIDKKWTIIQEVLYFGDRFYALDHWSNLLSFEVSAESNSNVRKLVHYSSKSQPCMKYLVVLNDKELLMVIRYYDYGAELRVTVGFKIFEFNFHKCDWSERDTLGNVALFLGDNSSVSTPVSNFPECQSNCIYFIHDMDRDGYYYPVPSHSDFGVYDVKTKKILPPFSMHATTLVKDTKWPPIWVVPTFYL